MSEQKQNSDRASALLEVHLHEFDKLKDEQIHRIQFRDNQIYVNLTATGVTGVFALAQPDHYPALLLIPWVNLVIGFLYISNDEKVSAIGRYFRRDLGSRIMDVLGMAPAERTAYTWGLSGDQVHYPVLFGWEVMHRRDRGRLWRKIAQFLTDELTFVVPGVAALYLYGKLSAWGSVLTGSLPQTAGGLFQFAAVTEALLLVALAVGIWVVADFGVGARTTETGSG
jgi:hypothetical protein